MTDNTSLKPFRVKDCTLAAIATGIKAQTLLELRDKLAMIPLSSRTYPESYFNEGIESQSGIYTPLFVPANGALIYSFDDA